MADGPPAKDPPWLVQTLRTWRNWRCIYGFSMRYHTNGITYSIYRHLCRSETFVCLHRTQPKPLSHGSFFARHSHSPLESRSSKSSLSLGQNSAPAKRGSDLRRNLARISSDRKATPEPQPWRSGRNSKLLHPLCFDAPAVVSAGRLGSEIPGRT